jgi:hypothetical protein
VTWGKTPRQDDSKTKARETSQGNQSHDTTFFMRAQHLVLQLHAPHGLARLLKVPVLDSVVPRDADDDVVVNA